MNSVLAALSWRRFDPVQHVTDSTQAPTSQQRMAAVYTGGVGSECCRSSGYCHSALRPHNAGALSTTLLPVRQRVIIKIATLVHRSLSRNSVSYLADDCRLVADARERRQRSTEPDMRLVTELLQLPVPGYGTVYLHIS